MAATVGRLVCLGSKDETIAIDYPDADSWAFRRCEPLAREG